MSQNNNRMTSPKGEAKYPRLNTPDTKFKKEGQYKVNLVLDAEDDFLDQIRAIEKQAISELAKNPKNKKFTVASCIKDSTDKDGNDVDGKVELAFKTTASGTKDGRPWERKVPLFDAKGKPVEANVGGGSIIKVAFSYAPYANPSSRTMGITLYLDAVQILELVEFKGDADAAGYGFGEEEGFEGGNAQFPPEGDEPDTDEDEGEDEPEAEEAPAPKNKKAKGRGDF